MNMDGLYDWISSLSLWELICAQLLIASLSCVVAMLLICSEEGFFVGKKRLEKQQDRTGT